VLSVHKNTAAVAGGCPERWGAVRAIQEHASLSNATRCSVDYNSSSWDCGSDPGPMGPNSTGS
jgi:hypothetical protein